MRIDPYTFAVACYQVLTDSHGNGFTEAHPMYLFEKLYVLSSGYGAYKYLDSENKMRLQEYLEKWGYKLPEEIGTYGEQV